MSAGRLARESGTNPVGSMMGLHAAFVGLVSATNGRSAIVKVFVIALCRAVVLDVPQQPGNAWPPLRLSSAVPRTHFFGLLDDGCWLQLALCECCEECVAQLV